MHVRIHRRSVGKNLVPEWHRDDPHWSEIPGQSNQKSKETQQDKVKNKEGHCKIHRNSESSFFIWFQLLLKEAETIPAKYLVWQS